MKRCWNDGRFGIGGVLRKFVSSAQWQLAFIQVYQILETALYVQMYIQHIV